MTESAKDCPEARDGKHVFNLAVWENREIVARQCWKCGAREGLAVRLPAADTPRHWRGETCPDGDAHVLRCIRCELPATGVAAADTATPPDPKGTFACPICGRDTPHGHDKHDIFNWLDAQASRFGYRMVDSSWQLAADHDLVIKFSHAVHRWSEPDMATWANAPMGRRTRELLRAALQLAKQQLGMGTDTATRPDQPKD